MDALIDWIYDTRLSWFITNYGWLWPINESLHFCALTVLAGTVGLFDLRVLGFVKGIAPSTLHATLPWGLAGFVVSVLTGAAHPSEVARNIRTLDAKIPRALWADLKREGLVRADART